MARKSHNMEVSMERPVREGVVGSVLGLTIVLIPRTGIQISYEHISGMSLI